MADTMADTIRVVYWVYDPGSDLTESESDLFRQVAQKYLNARERSVSWEDEETGEQISPCIIAVPHRARRTLEVGLYEVIEQESSLLRDPPEPLRDLVDGAWMEAHESLVKQGVA